MRKFPGIAAVIVGVVALTFWLVASSQGEGSHQALPVGGGHVKKVGPRDLRLGFGDVRLFSWTMLAEEGRQHSSRGRRVCFGVGLVGPLVHLPNGGGVMGPETGGRKCGPIKPTKGILSAVATKAGSQTLPSGKTESWQAFDVGVAAYPPSVGHVRLVFSDGASKVLKARSIPQRLAFKGAEPFHYVVFAFKGCVREVQGLARGNVVAHVGEPGCNQSPDE